MEKILDFPAQLDGTSDAISMLGDTDLAAREAQALQTWIDASAARSAAQVRHAAAVRTGQGVRTAARDVATAFAVEQSAVQRHRACSDELARRGLRPLRYRVA